MKRFTINGLAAAFILAGTMSAAVQPTINQRRENQQDRISQGVQSGQLTARETAHLETQEARLNRQIHDGREDHNGHLTARERKQINREQNKLSREIHRDKHNSFQQ